MPKECGEKQEYINLLIFQALQEQDEDRIEKDNKRLLQLEKDWCQEYAIETWIEEANEKIKEMKDEIQAEKDAEEIAKEQEEIAKHNKK